MNLFFCNLALFFFTWPTLNSYCYASDAAVEYADGQNHNSPIQYATPNVTVLEIDDASFAKEKPIISSSSINENTDAPLKYLTFSTVTIMWVSYFMWAYTTYLSPT